MSIQASVFIATSLDGSIARGDGSIDWLDKANAGVTIQRFLAAGLIDDLTITLIPVLLGSGKPLFGRLGNDISLTHQATGLLIVVVLCRLSIGWQEISRSLAFLGQVTNDRRLDGCINALGSDIGARAIQARRPRAPCSRPYPLDVWHNWLNMW